MLATEQNGQLEPSALINLLLMPHPEEALIAFLFVCVDDRGLSRFAVPQIQQECPRLTVYEDWARLHCPLLVLPEVDPQRPVQIVLPALQGALGRQSGRVVKNRVLIDGREMVLELMWVKCRGPSAEELSLPVINLVYQEDSDLGLNLIGLGVLILGEAVPAQRG